MFYKESEYIIERPGCTVHYWVSGNPEKPLLFFAHGAYVDHVNSIHSCVTLSKSTRSSAGTCGATVSPNRL
jgi:hypothetical protein